MIKYKLNAHDSNQVGSFNVYKITIIHFNNQMYASKEGLMEWVQWLHIFTWWGSSAAGNSDTKPVSLR
jgi:hypothetical protein